MDKIRIKAEKLINWRQLSMALTGEPYKITARWIHSDYKIKVDGIIKSVQKTLDRRLN